MNRNNMLKFAFIVGIIALIFGAWSKILHHSYADVLLLVGLTIAVALTIIGLYEVHTSKKVATTEKLMWTVGFILMNGITGFLYFIIYRRRIANNI